MEGDMGWNRKRTQLQSYFAGLFDGEGSVGLYPDSNNRRSWRLMVTVKMTDGASIGLLKKEYPEGVFKISTKDNPKHAPTVEFILYGNNCYRFLKEIKPFVIIKWQQVKVSLSYLVHLRKLHGVQPGRGDHHYPCERCERLAETIKRLKVVEEKGMITVNLLREHEMREYRSEPEQVEQDIRDITGYYKDAQEALETRLNSSTSNKAISLPEQDMVQA